MTALSPEWSFALFFGGGATPTITLPAPSGMVSHVVTDIDVTIFVAVVGGGLGVVFDVLDAATIIGRPCLVAVDGTVVNETSSSSWSGSLEASPGNPLTVHTPGAFPANIGGTLSIHGYDK